MRKLFAALTAAAFAIPALAADPPKASSAGVTLTTASVQGDALTWKQTEFVTKTGVRKVKKVVDGNEVLLDEPYTYQESVEVSVQAKLKDLKATDADGKELAADALEKKLKGGSKVVLFSPWSGFGDDFRKMFKEGTVFIQQGPSVLAVEPKKSPK